MLSNHRKTCFEDRKNEKETGYVVAWESSLRGTWGSTARVWEHSVASVLEKVHIRDHNFWEWEAPGFKQ